jgi:enolase
MSAIDIIGREILDSRGNPTVECDVLLESGVMGRAAVPSRRLDRLARGDRAARRRQRRYLGKGVLKAVENINTEISEAMMGLDATEQAFLDRTLIDLDGTDNKAPGRQRDARGVDGGGQGGGRGVRPAAVPLLRRLGRDAMPVPMMNVINGGAHANNNLDLQEFMIIPVGAPSFREAVRYGAEVFHALKKLIHDKPA